ncbi:peptidase family C78-domain-containing protein [Mycena capillaripes]|nr:peptidase family C78-domain-containing protein [Mycena capillaripes]
MSYTLSEGRIDSGPKAASTIQCQFCSANLDRLTVVQREIHYEKHFNNEPMGTIYACIEHKNFIRIVVPASGSSGKKPADSKSPGKKPDSKSPNKSWKDWVLPKGQDKFWYPAESSEPPHNFTPGFIPLLKTHLNKSHATGHTRRAVLCYDRAVLVTREVWDAGWGCGYRNFLMACASLMDQQSQPLYFPLLDDPSPPSVRNLQHWIEDAWKEGFDPEGAEQLRPLVGSKKWIGTSDIQVAFTSRGIPSKLVDFDLKTNARGAGLLTDWIVEYFSQAHGSVDSANVVQNPRPRTINDVLLGASPVVVTSRMPLILQHAGHSRTIVGYEVTKTGLVNLLVFDPSRIPKKSLRQAGLDSFFSMPPRHTPNTTTNAGASSSKRPGTSVSSNNPPPLKRSRFDNRGGRLQQEEEEDDDDEVIIVGDSRDENVPGRGKMVPKNDKKKFDDGEKMSTRDILQFFRLDPKKLEKKKAYQILYFPVSVPLDEAEKRRARGMNLYGEKIS